MPQQHLLAALLVTAVAALATGCAEPPNVTSGLAVAAAHDHAEARSGGAIVASDLAALKRETAPYHVIAKAKASGWDTEITPCWYSSGAGGAMGYHYGDVTRLDSVVDPLRPEALIYEPRQDGFLSLVGVEYIVPIASWQRPERPQLYGREFDRNDALGLYVMHVWAWRDNPDGMFAAWNAKVSCQYAAAAEDRG
jgi:hypothetical protein